MTAVELRTEITRMLKGVTDTSILEQVKAFLRERLEAGELDDDITDEEYAQFQEDLAKRERGEIRFLTREESMAEIRRLIDERRK